MALNCIILLFGNGSAKNTAKSIFENMHQVKQVTCNSNCSKMKLYLSEPIQEQEVIMLLEGSGIDGFHLL